MSAFLKNLGLGGQHSKPSGSAKGNLQFRDKFDPRILYKVSRRARRISLRVNPSDREVIVTMPSLRAADKARKFVKDKSDWINVQLEGLPQPQPFEDGAIITFKGDPYTLVCPQERGHPRVDDTARQLIVPAYPDTLAGRTERLLIREARSALEAASHHYAAKLGKKVGKVSVRDTRSRWGSCITRKGKGHISYSWRLICAPPFVLDYVAAHECAHMVQDNHSAAFWAVCQDIFPETDRARQWLRRYGAQLHAVGANH